MTNRSPINVQNITQNKVVRWLSLRPNKIVCLFSFSVQASDCRRRRAFPPSPSNNSSTVIGPIHSFQIVRCERGLAAPVAAFPIQLVCWLPTPVPSFTTEAAIVPHVRIRRRFHGQRRHSRLGRKRLASRKPRQCQRHSHRT